MFCKLIVAYIHRENDVSTLRSSVMVCILFLFATFAVATREICRVQRSTIG